MGFRVGSCMSGCAPHGCGPSARRANAKIRFFGVPENMGTGNVSIPARSGAGGAAKRQNPVELAFNGVCWCPGQESNLHALRHTHLKRARLPIPPPGHRHALCLFAWCKGNTFLGTSAIFGEKNRFESKNSFDSPREGPRERIPHGAGRRQHDPIVGAAVTAPDAAGAAFGVEVRQRCRG